MRSSFNIPGLDKTFIIPDTTPPPIIERGVNHIRESKREKAQEKKRWAKIRRKQGC